MTRADIAALVARRTPGFSLEAPFYTSQEIFDLDLDLIFARHWIFVATEPELPEPGDYVTVNVGPHSVVLVRDDDMAIKAFHNVCRHRGSRILVEPRGCTGNLVCPYHSWTYDLSGALIHADALSPTADRARLGLKPVHLRSLAGCLYICLADSPPEDFDAMAAELAPYLAPHHLQNCKVAAQIDLIEEGNWKLTLENNRECYHCGGHPELGMALFTFFGATCAADVPPSQLDYWEHFQKSQREFQTIWEGNGLPWQTIEKLRGRPTGFRTERLALDGAGESYTIDTKAASRKLVNGFTSPRMGGLHLHTQPNAWFHFLADHAITFSAIPVAPDRTLVRTTWLVDRDAVEGRDYDVERLTHVWKLTNQQDAAFVGYAHSGIRSPAYTPGPYAATEYMVEDFAAWYIERLTAAGLGVPRGASA
jgi:Rieske 2Fe-2S family protein